MFEILGLDFRTRSRVPLSPPVVRTPREQPGRPPRPRPLRPTLGVPRPRGFRAHPQASGPPAAGAALGQFRVYDRLCRHRGRVGAGGRRLCRRRLLLILIGSLVWLVPIQRTLQSGSELSAAAVDELRTRWLRGHLIRAIAGVAFVRRGRRGHDPMSLSQSPGRARRGSLPGLVTGGATGGGFGWGGRERFVGSRFTTSSPVTTSRDQVGEPCRACFDDAIAHLWNRGRAGGATQLMLYLTGMTDAVRRRSFTRTRRDAAAATPEAQVYAEPPA